jgi:hypothetical protein
MRLRFGAATSAAVGCGVCGGGGPVIVAVIPSSSLDVRGVGAV